MSAWGLGALAFFLGAGGGSFGSAAVCSGSALGGGGGPAGAAWLTELPFSKVSIKEAANLGSQPSEAEISS